MEYFSQKLWTKPQLDHTATKSQKPPEIPKTIFQPFDSHLRHEPVLQQIGGKIYSWENDGKCHQGRTSLVGGSPPQSGEKHVFLNEKKVVRNRSVWWTILNFQTRNLERQESCPGQSCFHVFSLSSLFLRCRASRNILCICRCNLTASKFPDLVLQSTAWMLGSWQ